MLLIDAGLIFRNFFGLPPMSDPQGRPVNGVYGFTAMTLKELAVIRPTHVAVAFDVPVRQNRRTTLFPDYKANRAICPPDLAPQFDMLRELLTLLNIPWLQANGSEADDIIGSMARKAESTGMEVSILTGDRDVFQLLTGRTQVRFTQKLNLIQTYDPARFATEFGLRPTQLVDLKGLAGDSSDNFPGIRGIGEKTAVRLLQEFGSAENVLDQAHTQKGKLRERLEGGREIALLCKQLATIDCTVSNLPDPRDCPLAIDHEAGRARFAQLPFRSLLSRLAV